MTRRQRPQARTTPGRAADVLQPHQMMESHQEMLLDRLLSHLLMRDEHTTNNNNSGLTLPAAAIEWLSILPQEEHHPKWVQVKALLPRRATHLRITTTPWPSTTGSSKKKQQLPISRSIVDLSLFSNIQVLWLDCVPVEWLVNTESLYETLRVLRIENSCIYNVSQMPFSNKTVQQEKSDPLAAATDIFSALTHVKLSNCCLGERSGLRGSKKRRRRRRKPHRKTDDGEEEKQLDLLLTTTTTDIEQEGALLLQQEEVNKPPPPLLTWSRSIQSLCLSHNCIQTEATALAGLNEMAYLSKLDLSYNLLTALPRAHLKLGNIQTLVLSHNRICTVTPGIDRLVSLETLWLDYNELSDLHTTASGLASLPLLRELYLEGNPLQFSTTTSRNRIIQLDENNDENDEVVDSSSLENNNNNNSSRDNWRRRRVKKSYRTDVLNAFRERRFANYSSQQIKSMSMRDVQAILPVLDGSAATSAELRALRSRTFTPVDTHVVIGAVTAAARQSMSAVSSVNGVVASSGKSRRCTRLKASRKVKITTRSDDEDNRQIPLSARETSRSYYADVTFTLGEVVSSLSPLFPLETTRKETFESGPENRDEKQQIAPTRLFVKETQDTAKNAFDESIINYEENIGLEYLAAVPNLSSEFDLAVAHQQKQQEPETFVKSSVSDETLPIANGNTDVDSSLKEDEQEAFGNHISSPAKAPQPEGSADELPVDSANDALHVEDELGNLSLSMIKNEQEVQDLKASAATTATTTKTIVDSSATPEKVALPKAEPSMTKLQDIYPAQYPMGKLKSNGETSHASTLSPSSVNPVQLSLRVTSFSENHWKEDDDNSSIPSSIATSPRDLSASAISKREAFQLAEAKSIYQGPNTYRKLRIRDNLELYFQLFVFAPSTLPDSCFELYGASRLDEEEDAWREILLNYPRIQLWPVDRRQREVSSKGELSGQFGVQLEGFPREEFRRVWKEKVVPCGKGALRRLTPSRAARYGFHGELLWSAAESSHMKPEIVVECRETICCFSDMALYIIADHDVVTNKVKDQKREFPRPIPENACFKDAKWPHALACHPFKNLQRITIGFGFQRLTLHFTDPASPSGGFTYILLTSNKMETISLLKQLQELSAEAREDVIGSPMLNDNAAVVTIENDDPHVLEALGAAVAPDTIGVVLHYQILRQHWKHGGRGTVRRVCVVTEAKLFLLDEDYVGDGSESLEADGNRIGESINRVVDSADLNQIVQVQAADADPTAITIVIKPSKLKRSHNWRLLCRDGHGAEKLVEDVRKAISLIS